MSESSYSGFFVCLEGIDGSGKTTHSRLLVKNLCSLGYDAVYTTEPTRYSIPGRKLRESFFAPQRLPVEEEFRLFLEDRIIHLKDEVIPQLEDGKIVVTDRYYFSSVAYQGSRGLDWRYILEENLKVSLVPDVVILLDIPVDEAIQRIAEDRTEGVNTFEKKESLQKVREIYILLAEENPYLINIVKGAKPIPTIQDELKDIFLSRYGKSV
ncbi:MAG: dTMP kinase [Candidatus Heimdallarchaeaceae archaeon]